MMVGGCAPLAASFFGLSWINTLVGFYLFYSVGRSMMQSATGHTLTYALVSKWFVRRRATAISVAALGGSMAGVVLAPVIQLIIGSYGWREAWAFFGLLTLTMALVPSALLLRRMPEDLGLHPDGDSPNNALPSRGSAVATVTSEALQGPTTQSIPVEVGPHELNLTLGEAVRTVPFWLLTFMVSVSAIAITGITFHMVPHFSDVGISDTVAASTISASEFTSMASVFVWGVLADRLGAKQMLLGALFSLGLGAFLVARADTATGAYVSSGIFGVGMGGFGLLSEVVWASFFGRKYLGSIRGAGMVLQLGGNASGSLISAFLYDLRGNYQDAFKVVVTALTASFVMLLLAKRPRPGTTEAHQLQ
jgi:MFS family permease